MWKLIKTIAKKYNVKVIEDAAHALGSQYNKKYIGNLSDFTIFSFQSIKQLTTSDGGMLIFKDKSKIFQNEINYIILNI
jgi:dTDP-4-amino-4,6-dideoxygalactose transaminase